MADRIGVPVIALHLDDRPNVSIGLCGRVGARYFSETPAPITNNVVRGLPGSPARGVPGLIA